MIKRCQSRLLRQLSCKGMAARSFCLVLFVWTTVYNPLHLLISAHSDHLGSEWFPAQGVVALKADDLDHGHGHEIHSASDHQMRATCQPSAQAKTVAAVISTAAVAEAHPPCFIGLFLVERVNPPGFDWPEPLLPRAPPVA